jgi:hypothetical protein
MLAIRKNNPMLAAHDIKDKRAAAQKQKLEMKIVEKATRKKGKHYENWPDNRPHSVP